MGVSLPGLGKPTVGEFGATDARDSDAAEARRTTTQTGSLQCGVLNLPTSPLAEILCACCKCNLSYVYYITMLKLFQSLLKLAHPLLSYAQGIFVVPTPPCLAGRDTNGRSCIDPKEGL